MYLFFKRQYFFIFCIATMSMATIFSMQNNFGSISEKHKQFLSELPNQALIQGILENQLPSTVLYLAHDPACILIKTNRTAFILAGEVNQDQLENIAQILSNYKKITLICSKELQSFFIKRGCTVQRRMAFEFVGLSDQLPELIYSQDYTLQLLDSVDIFRRCLWFSSISSLWGSSNNFIAHSFGSVLLNAQGKVVAEALVAWLGGGLAEIGVVTHPDFYGRGFSTLVTKYLIQECLKRNLTPCWSCNVDNIASIKVALKSGFKIAYYYNWLVKESSNKRSLEDMPFDQ